MNLENNVHCTMDFFEQNNRKCVKDLKRKKQSLNQPKIGLGFQKTGKGKTALRKPERERDWILLVYIFRFPIGWKKVWVWNGWELGLRKFFSLWTPRLDWDLQRKRFKGFWGKERGLKERKNPEGIWLGFLTRFLGEKTLKGEEFWEGNLGELWYLGGKGWVFGLPFSKKGLNFWEPHKFFNLFWKGRKGNLPNEGKFTQLGVCFFGKPHFQFLPPVWGL